MAKISLAGFADPVRRPRYIIWTGVVVLVFAAVMVTVLGVTSTRWFCSQGCHKVQDDTIVAYELSTHSHISCMACHMPVNANPVIFLIHKAEALGELAQTVTNNFELPLNKESEVALTMKTVQCTQCHNMANRHVSPDPGLKIDHQKHADKNIDCTICHNRIAHREDFALQLKNPKSGTPNSKHADFQVMTACFRCHGQEPDSPAPGACPACHTPGFDLKPPSHHDSGFFPKNHAELAKAAYETVAENLKETGQAAVTGERKAEFEAQSRQGGNKETIGQTLPPVGAIFYCGTCHKEQVFCLGCHGTQMPHAEEFKEPKAANDASGHPAISKKIPDKCVMCHTKDDPNFCNKCHHGKQLQSTFDTGVPWVNQHPKVVAKAKSIDGKKTGVAACMNCHAPTFCSDCHTKNHVVPSSHKQAGWVKPLVPTVTQFNSAEASAAALHSLAAMESTETCAVCHGPGGTESPFCKGCHVLAVPHSPEFKKNHFDTGRKNPNVCLNCHIWPELCSNCHHIGSSTSAPWLQVHGPQVEKIGSSTCTKTCHKPADCQNCHQQRKIRPPSHSAGNFVKGSGTTLGMHAQLYKKDGTICTYCHVKTGATLPESSFCMSCHKTLMPHPDGWGLKDKTLDPSGTNGGQHKDQLAANKVSRAVCANCHATAFCNTCHHKNGYVASATWMKYHPNVVKKNNATGCYAPPGGTTGCHQEQYCSECHVNAAKRGLLK